MLTAALSSMAPAVHRPAPDGPRLSRRVNRDASAARPFDRAFESIVCINLNTQFGPGPDGPRLTASESSILSSRSGSMISRQLPLIVSAMDAAHAATE
jgi:hypothetical protein